ncbi:ethanolamine ammonia-lyase large subunit domain protein [Mycobacteroides abscessus]|uniref:ethanolamine ammonia-lyase subunit EutB n=1 Tax=Mycobacteroides abscessus TaxID=36809 RepID=UPI00044DE131|nr:ethanolamine ammonia-lyase large subunit domain protein [Mycobacteroides abscessus]
MALLREANEAGRSLSRGTVGNNVMYLETGQGSALSAGAHLGVGVSRWISNLWRPVPTRRA